MKQVDRISDDEWWDNFWHPDRPREIVKMTPISEKKEIKKDKNTKAQKKGE